MWWWTAEAANDGSIERFNNEMKKANQASEALSTPNGSQQFTKEYHDRNTQKWGWEWKGGKWDPNSVHAISESLRQNPTQIAESAIDDVLNSSNPSKLFNDPSHKWVFDNIVAHFDTVSDHAILQLKQIIVHYLGVDVDPSSLRLKVRDGAIHCGSMTLRNTWSQQERPQQNQENTRVIENIPDDITTKLESVGLKKVSWMKFQLPDGRLANFGSNNNTMQIDIADFSNRSDKIYEITITNTQWQKTVLEFSDSWTDWKKWINKTNDQIMYHNQ